MKTVFTFESLFRAFVLPPASLFLLMAIGWLMQRRWPLAGRILGRAALLALLVLCMPAGADLLVAPLERRAVPLASSRGTGAQAIVVLAAGRQENAPEYGGTHLPDYIALARLRYAAHLQHETGLPILVSGGNRSRDAMHESKAASMARALREDFRTPVTWIEEQSETTAENALRSRDILRIQGVRRILLVTDAMHMARAEEVFRASGLEVVAAPTMFFTRRQQDLQGFLPNAEALRRAWYASYEWIGIAWYRLRRPVP